MGGRPDFGQDQRSLDINVAPGSDRSQDINVALGYRHLDIGWERRRPAGFPSAQVLRLCLLTSAF